MLLSWRLILVIIVPAVVGLHAAPGQEKPGVSKRTFTYKTVDKCAIKADVYEGPGKKVSPVAIWIHGGALIMGQGNRRSLILNWQAEPLLYNFCDDFDR